MEITMLQGKIHRATVTQAELHYVGSVTVDRDLLDAAGILEYQQVQVVNINTGARLETYTIAGEPGSGILCLNGAGEEWTFTLPELLPHSFGPEHLER